jgi:hypothetical protein
MSIASQNNFVAVYPMGVYADKKLQTWFTKEYSKYSKAKLDMGKSCLLFKKPDQIPYKLLGELASKITVNELIKTHETAFKR